MLNGGLGAGGLGALPLAGAGGDSGVLKGGLGAGALGALPL